MTNVSIFAGVEPVARDQVKGWRGWLLRDVPAGAEWRATIDRWLQNDFDRVRNEYRQRLLSEENGKAAYNELVLHAIVKELFGEAEREPPGLPVSGNPDLAAPVGGKRTVIEVATLAEQLGEDNRRRREIIKRLKAIHGPWVLIPDWRSRGLMEARLSTIEAKVRQYLETAPRERHRADIDLGDGRRLSMGVTPGQRSDLSIGILNFNSFTDPGISHVQREIKAKSGK